MHSTIHSIWFKQNIKLSWRRNSNLNHSVTATKSSLQKRKRKKNHILCLYTLNPSRPSRLNFLRIYFYFYFYFYFFNFIKNIFENFNLPISSYDLCFNEWIPVDYRYNDVAIDVLIHSFMCDRRISLKKYLNCGFINI